MQAALKEKQRAEGTQEPCVLCRVCSWLRVSFDFICTNFVFFFHETPHAGRVPLGTGAKLAGQWRLWRGSTSVLSIVGKIHRRGHSSSGTPGSFGILLHSN